MNGYNIKTSAFRVNGIGSDVYISDLPSTDQETGELFLFSVPNINSTSPFIVKRGIGTINYKKGIITINPINILSGKTKDGQIIIEVSGCPKSNDVIGLQDLYLQLDIGNSNFDMVVDQISSGIDPSASSYIITSSYANGSLVRPGGRGSIPSTPISDLSTSSITPTTSSGSYSPSTQTTTTTSSTSSTGSTPSTPSTPSSGGGGGGYSSGY